MPELTLIEGRTSPMAVERYRVQRLKLEGPSVKMKRLRRLRHLKKKVDETGREESGTDISGIETGESGETGAFASI